MSEQSILVLHPGDMGASVAAALRGVGHRVLWVEAGRSAETRARAREAGLLPRPGLEEAASEAGVLLSVCPPHAAGDTARAAASVGFAGLYVDCNAIAPASARAVGRIVESAGARFVDGGIIGPPATTPGTTRLYLSGPHAGEAAALFDGSPLEARTLDGPAEAASSLKMCYAAWTKGTTALLGAIRALARSLEVDAALLAEWDLSQSGLPERSRSAVCGNAFKAWRWIAEMEEIAASFEGEGLPPGFHQGAAEVYRRLEGFRNERDPELDAVLRALSGR